MADSGVKLSSIRGFGIAELGVGKERAAKAGLPAGRRPRAFGVVERERAQRPKPLVPFRECRYSAPFSHLRIPALCPVATGQSARMGCWKLVRRVWA